jgi:TPR repeat protein
LKFIKTIGLLLLVTSAAFAQDPMGGALKMGFSDVAVTKQKAESGDPQAQLSLADTLSYNFKSAEALEWYRKAAQQGLTKAKSRIGEMLMFGAAGIPSSQNVKAKPSQGIRWTFEAATNRDVKAILNMSKALQNGIGVSTNLIEAYAWLQLYSESDTIVGRVMLNQLALRLDGQSLQKAQAMTTQFEAGQWPSLSPRVLVEGDPRLKLNGVTNGKTSFAIINGKGLVEGESAIIVLKNESLKVKCIQIKQDAVLISIEGENEPRWLTLN